MASRRHPLLDQVVAHASRSGLRRDHDGQASARDNVIHGPVVERCGQPSHDVDSCTAHAARTHGAHVESDRHPVGRLADDVKGAAAVDGAVQQAPTRRDHDGAGPGHVGRASTPSGWLAGRGRRRRCPPGAEGVRRAPGQQESENCESGNDAAHNRKTSAHPSGLSATRNPTHAWPSGSPVGRGLPTTRPGANARTPQASTESCCGSSLLWLRPGISASGRSGTSACVRLR